MGLSGGDMAREAFLLDPPPGHDPPLFLTFPYLDTDSTPEYSILRTPQVRSMEYGMSPCLFSSTRVEVYDFSEPSGQWIPSTISQTHDMNCP